MQEFWLANHYEIVWTEDGSPTLRSLSSQTQETMHHRAGAYSETQLIYGEPLRQVLDQGARSVMSVGLGLGYNEFLIASEALQRGLAPASLLIESFESEVLLRQQFLEFLQNPSLKPSVYQEVLNRFLENKDFSGEAVCAWLAEALKLGTFILRDSLHIRTDFERRFELIFYDAFSSKTNPELWSDEFLNVFLQRAAATRCLLTTYACTGALKRALKNHQFLVDIRTGFQSKRDRTFASRGFVV